MPQYFNYPVILKLVHDSHAFFLILCVIRSIGVISMVVMITVNIDEDDDYCFIYDHFCWNRYDVFLVLRVSRVYSCCNVFVVLLTVCGYTCVSQVSICANVSNCELATWPLSLGAE